MRTRIAAREDVLEWLELRKGLWPHHQSEDLRREIEEILADPERNAAFLAYDDAAHSTPLGFIEISIRDSAPESEGKRIPYVEGWYVTPHARRQGVGKALMEAAVGWARNRGFDKLASDTTSNYPGSKEAHLAVGFEVVKARYWFLKSI